LKKTAGNVLLKKKVLQRNQKAQLKKAGLFTLVAGGSPLWLGLSLSEPLRYVGNMPNIPRFGGIDGR